MPNVKPHSTLSAPDLVPQSHVEGIEQAGLQDLIQAHVAPRLTYRDLVNVTLTSSYMKGLLVDPSTRKTWVEAADLTLPAGLRVQAESVRLQAAHRLNHTRFLLERGQTPTIKEIPPNGALRGVGPYRCDGAMSYVERGIDYDPLENPRGGLYDNRTDTWVPGTDPLNRADSYLALKCFHRRFALLFLGQLNGFVRIGTFEPRVAYILRP